MADINPIHSLNNHIPGHQLESIGQHSHSPPKHFKQVCCLKQLASITCRSKKDVYIKDLNQL